MNLIGISGRAGVGKDTVGKLIQFDIAKDKYGLGFDMTASELIESRIRTGFESWLNLSKWEQKAFADKLKEIASILTGYPVSNFHDQAFKRVNLGDPWWSPRQLLQKLGTDIIRKEFGDDVWINALFHDFDNDSKWIITDVRFPNEAQAIKQKGGIVIRVNTGREDDGDDLHISERAMDLYQYDYILNNSGTIEQLQEKVKMMLQHFELLEK